MGKMFSDRCLELVKKWEGCQLKAYKDEVGVLTIGYGITNSDKAITGVVIKTGMKITKEVAEEWLKLALEKKYLYKVLKYDSTYNWNINQLDALVSFCYNIGSIDGLTKNGTRSIKEISSKILEYNKAGGKVYKGLTNRRKDEKELFDKPVDVIRVPVLLFPARGYYQKGDKDLEIQYIQKLCNDIVKTNLAIDGDYGPKTEQAVIQLQGLIGVTKDGKFGRATLSACKKYYGEVQMDRARNLLLEDALEVAIESHKKLLISKIIIVILAVLVVIKN